MSDEISPSSQPYLILSRQTSEMPNPSNSGEDPAQYPAYLPYLEAGYRNEPVSQNERLMEMPVPAGHSRDGNHTGFGLPTVAQHQGGSQAMVNANPLAYTVLNIDQPQNNQRHRLMYAPPEDRNPLSLEEMETIRAHGDLDQDIRTEEMIVRLGKGHEKITTNAYIRIYKRQRLEIRNDFIDGMNSIKREKSDLMFKHAAEDQQQLQQQSLGRLHRSRLMVHREIDAAELQSLGVSRANLRRSEFVHLENKKQRYENEYHEQLEELEMERLLWNPRTAGEGQQT